MSEKCREKPKEPVYIGLEKAYHRILRQELWRCLTEKGSRKANDC